MRPHDIPEVLIILGVVGSLGLAVYNWTQSQTGCL
jgi:hypothetical protein